RRSICTGTCSTRRSSRSPGGGWLETAWREAVPATLAARRTLVLRPEHALLHLVSHLAVHHAFSGLLWYCDLGRLVRGAGLDWDRVLAGARELRLQGALDLVLDALGELFDITAPPEVARRIVSRSPRRSVARRLVHGRALHLESMDRWEHVLPWLVMD